MAGAGWRQSLSGCTAACEERGWGALPLAPNKLNHLFPELWSTARAAERWLSKKPLNPYIYISIIRLWGVLNTYRPPGQTSWSKALVRHGADGRLALAAVLGVPGEDIL